MVRQIKRAAVRAELGSATLWINDPDLAPITTRCQWPVLYDITDDWLEATLPPRVLARRAQREQHLLATAGTVVVCSEQLRRSKAHQRTVELIPNAVDIDRFQTDAPRPGDLPLGRVVLYVGTLHEDRLDVNLVERTAQVITDSSVVLVGPIALNPESRRRLERTPNIHLLGARSYADVPAYLVHADVLVVPHVVSPFTESLDPIKAYEYAASGRPVVATPVAGFRELEESVELADAVDFPERVAKLLEAPSPTSPVVGLPSWSERAQCFAIALEHARRPEEAVSSRQLRVVYLDHTARLSGGELALSRLLPSLVKCGVTPHVILGEDGPLVEELKSKGISVEVLPFSPEARELRRDRVSLGGRPFAAIARTLLYSWRVAHRLRLLQPDIVHTNSLKAALYGGVAGRIARVPTLWHVRDRIARDYLPVHAVALVRGLAHVLPSAVIANSHATLSTLGELRGPMAVAPSPVVMDAVEIRAARTRRSGEAFTVGMLGRLSPWKGQHVFLEAFAIAFPDGSERAVVAGSAMFGEDEYAAALMGVANRLGIAERVTFAGFVKDTARLLGDFDVLVHASIVPEPFGQVVIEGMAAGIPVIASGAGGPLEIVTDGVDGFLTPPDDRHALAAALRRLAADPVRRRDVGERARRRAEAFHPDQIAEQLMSVYQRIGGAA
jgi:glycosyltransferase involved in cell wall biosynthesis